MAPDDDPDDERLPAELPPSPDDRLWRHPSELAAGIRPPSAWGGAASTPPTPGRTVVAGALAGACLVGAMVAVGAMWATRPTRVIERSIRVAASTTPVVTASFTVNPLPTERLAADLGPSLASVRVERADEWTAGTGVWLDADGALLTATPLVARATQILVTGRDGVARPASIAGRDPGTAISVLAVSRTSGTPVSATAAAPRSGQLVAVMGAPDAVAGSGNAASSATTATTVVRVAKMRVTLDDLVLHDAVQLDRAMPDDAVGGLVVDSQGHLVAIALGRGTDGSGTAIPATDAISAARALRSDGRVQRAWLGVRATDLDPAVATMLEVPGGARVTEMTPGSPAVAAGIEVGDIIEGLGDQPIEDASDLVLALRSLHPGDRVTLSVERKGEGIDMTVVLGG